MTDEQLQRMLAEAAADTTYPPTPDFVGRILSRPESRPALRLRLSFSPAAVFVIALVVSLTVALMMSPGGAIARFFGVAGSTIERLPAFPKAISTPLPEPGDLGGLAKSLSLSEAEAAAGFEVALPAGGAVPIQTYLIMYAGEPVVVLRYEGFDLWQTQLRQTGTFGKGVEEGGTILDVSVGPEAGTWLTGGRHFVSYILPNGELFPLSTRVVDANTLIWRTPAAFYRLETQLSLDEALRIAETLP
jgi:hypothetical protein